MKLSAHGKTVEIGFADPTDHISRRITQTRDFYERALLDDCYQSAPEGIVVDAGAHIGNHTLFFAGVMGRKVVAFEPHPGSFVQLTENVEHNGLSSKVWAHAAALGAKAGRCKVNEPTQAANSGSRTVTYDTGTVSVMALDDLDLDIAVLKCDVEGNELAVLQGARATLERCHPLVYVEASSEDDVSALLGCLGYDHRGWFGATKTHAYAAA